jgi:hypothetical protein
MDLSEISDLLEAYGAAVVAVFLALYFAMWAVTGTDLFGPRGDRK